MLTSLAVVLLIFRLRRPQPSPPGAQEPSQRLPLEAGSRAGTLPIAGEAGIPSAPLPALLPTERQGGEDILLFPPNASFANSPTGGILGFDPDRAGFIAIDAKGAVRDLTQDRFFDVEGVRWSNDRQAAVLEHSNNTKTLYFFNTRQRVALPSTWEELSFGPSASSIAFKNAGARSDLNWLATADTKNGSIRIVFPLEDGANRVHVNWSPDSGTVGFATIPRNGTTQDLYFISQDGSLSAPSMIEGAFFQSQWSPDGKLILSSTADPENLFRPRLWIALGEGPQRGVPQELPIATTADQCTFLKKSPSIICAVPDSPAPSGYGIDGPGDDWPHRVISVNLITGMSTLLYSPRSPSALRKPVVTQDGKTLFVTNRTTSRLERIPLTNF